MDILTIAYGVVFGMFLSIGDRMATEYRMQYGFNPGFMTWIGLVAVPIAIFAFVVSLPILIVGAIVGALLSTLLFFYERHQVQTRYVDDGYDGPYHDLSYTD